MILQNLVANANIRRETTVPYFSFVDALIKKRAQLWILDIRSTTVV
jgi:hypothetical protein